jgi:hypothetical protein
VPTVGVAGETAPRLMDLEAAARYLGGISVWTVRDLIDAGTLHRVVIPVGQREVRRILLDRVQLDELIERWREAPA